MLLLLLLMLMLLLLLLRVPLPTRRAARDGMLHCFLWRFTAPPCWGYATSFFLLSLFFTVCQPTADVPKDTSFFFRSQK